MGRIVALMIAVLAALPAAANAQKGRPELPVPQVPALPPKPDVRDLPFSREAVLTVVSSHQDQIQQCYEDAMKARGANAKSAPQGRVVMSWAITPDGITADVRVKRSEIEDDLVTDCMANAIRYWEFPRPQTRQPVEFPFDLKPARMPGSDKDRT